MKVIIFRKNVLLEKPHPELGFLVQGADDEFLDCLRDILEKRTFEDQEVGLTQLLGVSKQHFLDEQLSHCFFG